MTDNFISFYRTVCFRHGAKSFASLLVSFVAMAPCFRTSCKALQSFFSAKRPTEHLIQTQLQHDRWLQWFKKKKKVCSTHLSSTVASVNNLPLSFCGLKSVSNNWSVAYFLSFICHKNYRFCLVEEKNPLELMFQFWSLGCQFTWLVFPLPVSWRHLPHLSLWATFEHFAILVFVVSIFFLFGCS